MSHNSNIEWTNATWNPVTGCAKVSAGCKNCYAERDWQRLSANPNSVYYGRKFNDVAWHPERLDQPLRWRDPRMIFVNSMSDLFHPAIPFEVIDSIFAVMAVSEQHTFQVLTKRPERMRNWTHVAFKTLPRVGDLELERSGHRIQDTTSIHQQWDWPLGNVWLGVSVESQAAASRRLPLLLKTPAAVRWISAEPLLNQIRLDPHALCQIDWVVAGGESGPHARPSHPDWFRSLRDQCVAMAVPFFFKQWGEWIHESQTTSGPNNVGKHLEFGGHTYRVGKKQAGRVLDGRTWDEYPK